MNKEHHSDSLVANKNSNKLCVFGLIHRHVSNWGLNPISQVHPK